MGKTINSNIRVSYMDSYYDEEVMKGLVKNNPLVILDNVVGKYYYHSFDGYNFKNNPPLIVETMWSLGSGVGVELSFFFDNRSPLYLPTLIIQGVVGGVSFELAKEIFKFLKSKFHKRQPIIYYSEKEGITFYEFPSETSVKEFEEGLNEIPNNSMNAKSGSTHIRSLKNKKWVKEDKD